EALETLTDQFLLFRAAITPVLKPLLGLCALLRRQVLPASGTLDQAALPLRRQALPILLQGAEQLLLLLAEGLPIDATLCQGRKRQAGQQKQYRQELVH